MNQSVSTAVYATEMPQLLFRREMQFQRLAIAALVATLVLDACVGSKGPGGPQALNVDVAPAKLQDISTNLSLDGQVAPLEQSTLAFQQSAPIIEITVNIGDV